jgi:uncharacterized damage-inducible protein DinB
MSQLRVLDEREMLRAYLNAQRKHVFGILEGLSEEDLRRPILPSGWSCLGLVQHLALDVEQFWFRAVIAGEQTVIDALDQVGGAWQVASDAGIGDIFDLYRQEIDFANAIITATPLDTAPAWWPNFFGDWRLHDLRELVLHVITETACHAGHLDVVRELIDGRRWLVLTD